MGRPVVKVIVGTVLAAVLLATAGTWGYINLIREDAPERLTLDGAGATDDATTTTTSGGTSDSTTTAAAAGGVEGTWTVADGSQAGYRVNEILFGQRAEAVGRTEDVTGQFEITGSQVTSGSFTVDMTSVESDESRRDNQYRGRIMNVATYPTSTFELASPIDIASLPGDGEEVTYNATGDLTLRGTTKRVTVDLQAQRSGANIRVAGTFHIVFEEWGIPNPSFGPADTEDNGELEFLLVFSR